MWFEIALVIAGLVYATAQNASTGIAPVIAAPKDDTADRRFHVQYLQQLLAVQAAQLANINAIYGFMLPVILFLLQFVAAPIQIWWVRWLLYGLYSLLALIILVFVGMRRPELYSSNDPLARGTPATITVENLGDTHIELDKILKDNEKALRSKHDALPFVLLAGILITVSGGAIDGTQHPEPQAVSFPTPVPVIVQTPIPTPTKAPTPTPAPTKAASPAPTAGKRPGKMPAAEKAPSAIPTPLVKQHLAPSGILR